MRKLVWGIVLLVATAAGALAQVPVLRYTFDDAGPAYFAAPSSGSTSAYLFTTNSPVISHIRNAPVTGPSGQSSDYVLDLHTSASGMGQAGSFGTTDGNFPTQYHSFTLSGWFYNASGAVGGNGATLIDDSRGGSGFDLGFTSSSSSYDLSLTVNGSATASTTGNLYGASNSWVFFAVTYDGTISSNNVQFYVGNTTSLSLAGAFSLGAGSTDPLNFLYVGNSMTGSSVFDGYLDDLSLYGGTGADGALSFGQIDTVRTSIVPEPSLAWLAVGGIVALWAFRGISSRRNAAL
jgi:hypothetical protein